MARPTKPGAKFWTPDLEDLIEYGLWEVIAYGQPRALARCNRRWARCAPRSRARREWAIVITWIECVVDASSG